MSSKKDLVEAHSFNRRRLITAFVSGAPGGREVEPVRYGRTLSGGWSSRCWWSSGPRSRRPAPTLPKGWNEKGLVIGKESGSRFVAFDKTLYPVINTTSARLILGTEGDFEVNFVPDDEIAKQKQGATIGIPGAPDLLPTPQKLIPTGWTACVDDEQQVKTRLSRAAGCPPRGSCGPAGRGGRCDVRRHRRQPVPRARREPGRHAPCSGSRRADRAVRSRACGSTSSRSAHRLLRSRSTGAAARHPPRSGLRPGRAGSGACFSSRGGPSSSPRTGWSG